MNASYGLCDIQFDTISILVFFIFPFVINELISWLIKRKARMTTLFFVSTAILWLLLIPFHPTALLVSLPTAYFGFYLGWGPSLYPRFVRNHPEMRDPMALFALISRKLAVNGRLIPYAVSIVVVSSWLYLILYKVLWMSTFGQGALLILGIASILYGITIGFLTLLHRNYKTLADVSGKTIINDLQFVFAGSIFGEVGKESDSQQAPPRIFSVVGGTIALLGTPGWIQIVYALLAVLLTVNLHPAGLLYGFFDEIFSRLSLIGASVTQDVDALHAPIAEYCFNLAVGIAIAGKQRWARNAYLLFTPFVIWQGIRTTEYDAVAVLLSLVVYLVSLVVFNLPRNSKLFIRTGTDKRKVLAAIVFYLACVIFSWGMVRVSSAFQLLEKSVLSEYILPAAVTLIGLALIFYVAFLWDWTHRSGIVGLSLAVTGFLFLLNSAYRTTIWCSTNDFGLVQLDLTGRFFFAALLFLIGIALLIQQRKVIVTDTDVSIAIPDYDFEPSAALSSSLERLSAMIRSCVTTLVWVALFLGCVGMVFFTFNDFKAAPVSTTRQYWASIKELGDGLKVNKTTPEQRIQTLEEITRRAIAGPVYHTILFPVDQAPIELISRAFKDPSIPVRVTAVQSLGTLIRERPDMYGIKETNLVILKNHSSLIGYWYATNYLGLSRDKAPEVRIALAREIAETDIQVESMTGTLYASSRQTLVVMIKVEDDPVVYSVIEDALSTRLQRDYENGLVTFKEVKNLIEKYELQVLLDH